MQFTATTLAACGVDGVKIHNLYVVRDTSLESQFKAGTYRCLEREDYAERVVDVLERLPARVVIQRLTGDPHAAELAAPDWCRDKRATLAAIRAALERRNTWQGRLCGDGPNGRPSES
jgi:radical SAM superfamily enzyme